MENTQISPDTVGELYPLLYWFSEILKLIAPDAKLLSLKKGIFEV